MWIREILKNVIDYVSGVQTGKYDSTDVNFDYKVFKVLFSSDFPSFVSKAGEILTYRSVYRNYQLYHTHCGISNKIDNSIVLNTYFETLNSTLGININKDNYYTLIPYLSRKLKGYYYLNQLNEPVNKFTFHLYPALMIYRYYKDESHFIEILKYFLNDDIAGFLSSYVRYFFDNVNVLREAIISFFDNIEYHFNLWSGGDKKLQEHYYGFYVFVSLTTIYKLINVFYDILNQDLLETKTPPGDPLDYFNTLRSRKNEILSFLEKQNDLAGIRLTVDSDGKITDPVLSVDCLEFTFAQDELLQNLYNLTGGITHQLFSLFDDVRKTITGSGVFYTPPVASYYIYDNDEVLDFASYIVDYIYDYAQNKNFLEYELLYRNLFSDLSFKMKAIEVTRQPVLALILNLLESYQGRKPNSNEQVAAANAATAIANFLNTLDFTTFYPNSYLNFEEFFKDINQVLYDYRSFISSAQTDIENIIRSEFSGLITDSTRLNLFTSAAASAVVDLIVNLDLGSINHSTIYTSSRDLLDSLYKPFDDLLTLKYVSFETIFKSALFNNITYFDINYQYLLDLDDDSLLKDLSVLFYYFVGSGDTVERRIYVHSHYFSVYDNIVKFSPFLYDNSDYLFTVNILKSTPENDLIVENPVLFTSKNTQNLDQVVSYIPAEMVSVDESIKTLKLTTRKDNLLVNLFSSIIIFSGKQVTVDREFDDYKNILFKYPFPKDKFIKLLDNISYKLEVEPDIYKNYEDKLFSNLIPGSDFIYVEYYFIQRLTARDYLKIFNPDTLKPNLFSNYTFGIFSDKDDVIYDLLHANLVKSLNENFLRFLKNVRYYSFISDVNDKLTPVYSFKKLVLSDRGKTVEVQQHYPDKSYVNWLLEVPKINCTPVTPPLPPIDYNVFRTHEPVSDSYGFLRSIFVDSLDQSMVYAVVYRTGRNDTTNLVKRDYNLNLIVNKKLDNFSPSGITGDDNFYYGAGINRSTSETTFFKLNKADLSVVGAAALDVPTDVLIKLNKPNSYIFALNLTSKDRFYVIDSNTLSWVNTLWIRDLSITASNINILDFTFNDTGETYVVLSKLGGTEDQVTICKIDGGLTTISWRIQYRLWDYISSVNGAIVNARLFTSGTKLYVAVLFRNPSNLRSFISLIIFDNDTFIDHKTIEISESYLNGEIVFFYVDSVNDDWYLTYRGGSGSINKYYAVSFNFGDSNALLKEVIQGVPGLDWRSSYITDKAYDENYKIAFPHCNQFSPDALDTATVFTGNLRSPALFFPPDGAVASVLNLQIAEQAVPLTTNSSINSSTTTASLNTLTNTTTPVTITETAVSIEFFNPDIFV